MIYQQPSASQPTMSCPGGPTHRSIPADLSGSARPILEEAIPTISSTTPSIAESTAKVPTVTPSGSVASLHPPSPSGCSTMAGSPVLPPRTQSTRTFTPAAPNSCCSMDTSRTIATRTIGISKTIVADWINQTFAGFPKELSFEADRIPVERSWPEETQTYPDQRCPAPHPKALTNRDPRRRRAPSDWWKRAS